MKEKDISGVRFGRLVAVRSVGKGNSFQLQWECRCDCGMTVVVNKKNLLSGHTRSCGCLRRDMLILRNHGRSTVGRQSQEGAGV